MTLQRRRFLTATAAAGSAALLPACGFQLRQAPDFAFESIYLASTSPVAQELRRTLVANPNLRVLDATAKPETAQVVLDLSGEQREKVVVGRTATGQVREFQLRTRARFRLRTPQGRELIPETELAQQRDISFNESAVLSKEAEENLLYRDMQTDIVQQLLRRLAALKAI